MRVAFFSPMPPTRSGIADYSAALLEPLAKLASVTVFERAPDRFAAGDFDVVLYQIGNNGHHAFVYRQALETPGVVVMHEANLHHLIAEMTIKNGDWDAYLREVEFDGGLEALAFANRVRALEIGPDYEGVPMMRRILSCSRGVIAHSRCVAEQLCAAGFSGPVGVIPHGAWIPDADRVAFRARLDIDPSAPLIGIFGYLKPYKRIAESLRAFKRLLRVAPSAKMILVGEPHPEFALQPLIAGLGIGGSVRILGFTPMEDFVGYLSACDIVLNLRFPTVGESSGTLLRSLGLGRVVVVSDIGSFREYPDEICLKVPVDAAEEDTIFEYLSLLVARPDLRDAMGARAREWVERECNWPAVAERYLEFLDTVVSGSVSSEPNIIVKDSQTPTPDDSVIPATENRVDPEYIFGWAATEDGRNYVQTHITRFERTLRIIPPGAPDSRILEMGAYMQITPALKIKLGYGEVRGCYYGPLGQTERKEVTSVDGEHFVCDVDLFDAEKDRFPYADEWFDTVLCCELVEHLPSDPMHMMSEVNRILKPGGHFVLTTPNICSFRAIAAILQGYHPGFFPAYIRPAENAEETEARHAREYAPREIAQLFNDAGFDLSLLETGEFRDEIHPEYGWVRHLLATCGLSTELRGDGIYAVGIKAAPVRERFPAWLYS